MPKYTIEVESVKDVTQTVSTKVGHRPTVKKVDGKELTLNNGSKIWISDEDFKELKEYKEVKKSSAKKDQAE